MLRNILGLAFISAASCYNKPEIAPSVSSLASILNDLSSNKTSTKGAGVLQLGVAKLPSSVSQLKTKRQSTDSIANVQNGYTINIALGTAAQSVTVILDTGSSELWVNPVCANSYYPAACTGKGIYNPASSSTKADLHKTFSINYGSGSAAGEYLTDVLTMGSAKLTAQQFGNATNSQYTIEGIMGLSYNWPQGYKNVVDQLYAQGVTKSRAFSLDLASVDVSSGSIIFGGVDLGKYIGKLEKRGVIPYTSAPDHYPRYWFNMTSVGITKPGATCSQPVASPISQPVFPDSGSTLSALPSSIFNSLLSYFPDAVSQGNGYYTVPCSYRSQAGSIDFGFGGTTIHVSYHEWFWFDGQKCWFGATTAPTNTYILGDSFMRSAYVVYDQDNNNVLLAQAANCGTNVIPIGSGVNAVPSSTGACTATTAVKPACATTTKVGTRSTSLPAPAKFKRAIVTNNEAVPNTLKTRMQRLARSLFGIPA